ncbi:MULTISPECIES: thiamine phosphate synthase [Pseudanabaena]|uniref:Thiamine-phosphate synthase n=2 Tax=Pseudanabaena TaxID=1152 RepID=L8MTS4_9CYAN|nr:MULTISPECIES: thiamine phosphate synthase [Pseudanabaena]ELS30831.1 thiamine-phosphate diphosphorylase [Pseudanabaena biceps PCC 7429]MDG3496899.1 thiamine phosphate synthase [Pseudanabaena catenata USMAC16]
MSQQIIYRILDANLDRAREALRTIEEWCRFGLENVALCDRCKQMRQELALWHREEFRLARNTPDDPATGLSHANEISRTDIQALLRANMGRLQEALRVLEEYGKVVDPNLGAAMKQMRYQVYTLESKLLEHEIANVGQIRRQKLRAASLYLVTMPVDNIVSVVESALQGGVQIVQYRQKEGEDNVRYQIAQQLCEVCHKYDALFLVNDRVDIAIAVGADGIHVGQTDLPVTTVRQILNAHGGDASQYIIGQSTTNPQELAIALGNQVDYVGVGPVHATPTKPTKAAAGYDYVSYATQNIEIPWFAIGGIDEHNLEEAINVGARRVAVVRALMQADHPDHVAKQMRSLLSQ